MSVPAPGMPGFIGPVAVPTTLARMNPAPYSLVVRDFEVLGARIARAEGAGALRAVPLSELRLTRSYVEGPDRGPRAVIPSSGTTRHGTLNGLRFDALDQRTDAWYPQGLTTSFDSVGTHLDDGKAWMAVSWHSAGDEHSRITFLDHTQPDKPEEAKYRHALLVTPVENPAAPGGVDFQSVRTHAGGVAWFKNYLYVADTGGGLRVFDTRHLWEVRGRDPSVGFNPISGSFSAQGEGYVLPQVGWFQLPVEGGRALAVRGQNPRFSGLSVDRSSGTPALLVPEYVVGAPGGRLLRWPLDPQTGLLARGPDGRAHPDAGWSLPIERVSGVAKVKDEFYVSAMRGREPPGIWRAEENQPLTRVDTSADGLQQLAYDGDEDRLWAFTEHPGSRSLWRFDPE